ncbi:hypothetical protein D3C86_1131860 [compost metagenome]
MSARYLLCPGPVTSKTDGDRHHITARQLAHLYGVPMKECVVLPDAELGALGGGRRRTELQARADRGELITLYPRYNGDYSLPNNKQDPGETA